MSYKQQSTAALLLEQEWDVTGQILTLNIYETKIVGFGYVEFAVPIMRLLTLFLQTQIS